jgi:hypothetical protein
MPFAPFDLFDWITSALPWPLITFDIDFMIDELRLMGLSVTSTAKTAEHISDILNFLATGTMAGVLFFVVFRLPGVGSDMRSGL